MKIYVSLPITGQEEKARVRAAKAKELLQQKHPDAEIVTPFDVVTEANMSYPKCMGICTETLLGCDMAYFLPGWEQSKGCQSERANAQIYGIHINEYVACQMCRFYLTQGFDTSTSNHHHCGNKDSCLDYQRFQYSL